MLQDLATKPLIMNEYGAAKLQSASLCALPVSCKDHSSVHDGSQSQLSVDQQTAHARQRLQADSISADHFWQHCFEDGKRSILYCRLLIHRQRSSAARRCSGLWIVDTSVCCSAFVAVASEVFR